MKNARTIILLALIIAVGVSVMARVDWLREKKFRMAETLRSGDRLVGLIALHPIHDGDAGIRNLLVKTLIEQSSGEDVAYLLIHDQEGQPLLTVGDLTSRVSAEVSVGSPATAGILRQRFMAPDESGEILEFAKPLIQPGGQAGTVRLGLRIPAPPLVSVARISFVATVAFLMVAAMVIGYYAILLAARRLDRAPGRADAMVDALTATRRGGSESILATIQHLDRNLTEARTELHTTGERIAELSSSLGVAAFEKEQAYRVLDSLDFGILILDVQERIRHANRHMLGLLGAKREEVLGRSYADALQHKQIADLVENRTSGTDRDHSSRDAQFEKGAPGRFFRLTCRPVQDSTGDSIGTLITAEDITRARIAEKAQDDFVAQVAHELFTPLTSIKAYAEMLMMGDVIDPEMLKEYCNTINDETDRLTGLIKNLLSVAKMEAGTLTIERALVKTDWLLDQSLPAIDATAKAKRITIAKQLPDKFPTIMGDKDLLKVVLVNILGNAVKYTPEAGTIRISLLEQDHSVFFEVSDTGCGIPPKDLPHLFDKFYRGAAAAVRDQSGSGMGLATAMQIVKLHGGAINVISEIDKGSCFTVRIPAEEFTLEKR